MVCILGKIFKRHSQLSYSILGMSLQVDWQYLQRTFPRVGTVMYPIEEDLRETFFPTIFGGQDDNTDFQKILGYKIKCGILDIPDPGCQKIVSKTPPRHTVGNQQDLSQEVLTSTTQAIGQSCAGQVWGKERRGSNCIWRICLDKSS